jgi:hypothetical protein
MRSGLEAPRNSVEGEVIDQAKTSSSSVVEDEYFEIPVSHFQVINLCLYTS